MDSFWSEVRAEFPALAKYAYLNAAAASPTPRVVRAAVDRYSRELEEEGDACWEAWLARAEEVRADVSRFIGATPDEVAFVDNTSAGMNLVVDLIGDDGPVVSDDLEFPTVTLPWVHRGVSVTLVPAVHGVVPLDGFTGPGAPHASTMVVSHVQFSNGCRQDLDAFGAAKGSRHFVVCASQSAGAFRIDVGRSGVDALACSGHKWLCAGYGAGFLYVSRALIASRRPRTIGWLSVQDPFTFERVRYRLLTSNRRVELGCPSFGPIFALGAAVRFLNGIGMARIEARVLALNALLTDALRAAGIDVRSPGGAHRSGETLAAVPDPPAAAAFLKARGVAVTEKAEGVRLATHFYNDERDVERGVAALAEYVRGSR